MYRKPMATNSYLLKSSCHPNHVTNNIPYGLALRIKMICSEQESFEKEVQKLKSMLVKRNYKAKNVELMFDEVHKMDRKDILRVKSKELLEKTAFVYPYFPQLPLIH